MKKTTIGMGAVVVGLAMLTLSAVSSPAAQRPGYETYVVRSGDTLSKISGRVFGDVKRWREILKDNPQVTNANLIFPGDTLLVPVPETAAPSGGTGGGLAARAGAEAGTSDAGSGSVRTEIVAAPAATGDQGAVGSGSSLTPRPGPEPAPKRGRISPPQRPSRRWSGCDRPHSSTPRSIALPATLRTSFPRSRSSLHRTIGSCSGPTMRPSSMPRSPRARASRWSAPTAASFTR